MHLETEYLIYVQFRKFQRSRDQVPGSGSDMAIMCSNRVPNSEIKI